MYRPRVRNRSVRTLISEGKVMLYGFYGEIWRNFRALEQLGDDADHLREQDDTE